MGRQELTNHAAIALAFSQFKEKSLIPLLVHDGSLYLLAGNGRRKSAIRDWIGP